MLFKKLSPIVFLKPINIHINIMPFIDDSVSLPSFYRPYSNIIDECTNNMSNKQYHVSNIRYLSIQ